MCDFFFVFFFFQAEDGIRDLVRSRGLGDVYKRQGLLKRGRKTDKDSPFSKPHPAVGGGKSPTGHFQWIMHSELGSKFYYFIISPEV